MFIALLAPSLNQAKEKYFFRQRCLKKYVFLKLKTTVAKFEQFSLQ